MIHFSPLTLSDFEALRRFFDEDRETRTLSGFPRRICDVTQMTVFMWRNFYRAEYAVLCDALVLRYYYYEEGPLYLFPIGASPDGALYALRDEARREGKEIYFFSSAADDLPRLCAIFGTAEASAETDWFDYIYDRAAFAAVSGKKYHGQRNFINRFRKLYPDACLIPITEANTARAADFCRSHYRRTGHNDLMLEAEHKAILEILDNWKLYAANGMLLTAGEQTVGMTIGEAIGDTVYVHAEKADTSYPGSYPTLAAGYAASFQDPALLWLNREDDLGDEGLRCAKESWHPVRKLEKYTVICR